MSIDLHLIDSDYFYDEVTGTAIVTYKDAYGHEYTGVAQVAEVDKDMQSSYTGYQIAEARALLETYKGIIRNEFKPRLRAYKQLYYSMNRSKNYSDKHYEARMLKRAIKHMEAQIEEVEQYISNIKEFIEFYIKEKDSFYQTIRQKRMIENDEEIEPTSLDDID